MTMTNEELDRLEALASKMTERGIVDWPPVKKAIWLAITSDELNAKYVNAWDLTDEIFAAVSAETAGSREAVPVLIAEVRRLREAHKAIIERSTNDPLGTSKVNDMRRIARDAIEPKACGVQS